MPLWIDGLDATIRQPEEMAILSLEATLPIWRQSFENREPIASAFRRLLNRDYPQPILFVSAVYHEGRWKSLNAMAGGILLVQDAAQGTCEIRVMRREVVAALTRVQNVAAGLRSESSRSPFAFAPDQKHQDGRIGEAGLRWIKQGSPSV